MSVCFNENEKEDGRVEKTPKSRADIMRWCLLHDPLGTFLVEGGLGNYADRLEKNKEKTIQGLKNNPDGLHLIGDLEIEGNRFYQKRGKSVKYHLYLNPKNYKNIIDEYLGLLKDCWSYGFSESSFNFTIMFSYSDDEEMFLSNFSELTFSKEKVRKQIENKKWKSQRVCKWELQFLELLSRLRNPLSGSYEIRSYFISRMEEEVTIEELERLWRSEV